MNPNFHITKFMPKDNLRAIIEVEGVCPCCQGKNTLYGTTYRDNDTVIQNSYCCKDCESEWMGNSYSMPDFRPIPYPSK